MPRFSSLTSLKKGGLFFKIFTVLISIMVIPTVVIFMISYSISTEYVHMEASKAGLQSIKQTKEAFDNILKLSERISMQVSIDERLMEMTNRKLSIHTLPDITLINETIYAINYYMESAAYIENIYVYSNMNDMFLSPKTGIYEKLSEADRTRYLSIASENSKGAWIDSSENEIPNGSKGSIQFIKPLYTSPGQVQGFMLIQLKDSELVNLLEKIYMNKSGYIFIINKKNNIIVNSNIIFEDIIKKSLNDNRLNGSEGVTAIENGNNTLFISYATSTYNGWKYISVMPENETNSTGRTALHTILIVCLLFMGLAVIMSFFIAKGIYDPIAVIAKFLKGEKVDDQNIKRMLMRKDEFGEINSAIYDMVTQLNSVMDQNNIISSENHSLKAQVNDNIDQLKDYFLYRLVKGEVLDHQEIIRNAAQFKIPVDKNYIVVIFDFDKGYYGTREKLTKSRINLLRSEIFETIRETLSESGLITAFYEEYGRIIAIMAIEIDKNPEIHAKIREQCNAANDVIAAEYDLTLTICIGEVSSHIWDLRSSYDDAVNIIEHKFILGSNTIIEKKPINYRENINIKDNDFVKQLRLCLEAEKVDTAIETLDLFKQELQLRLCPSSKAIFKCKILLNNLLQMVKSKDGANTGGEVAELEYCIDHFEEQFDDIEQVMQWTKNYIVKMFNKGSRKINPLIEKAVEIINNSYSNDITLFTIADQLSVSVSYISRLFKDETGKNFKEYLTELRMKKAKELLASTNLPVQEIAKMVGYYNNIQFARMFKKYEQISAIEYRNINSRQ